MLVPERRIINIAEARTEANREQEWTPENVELLIRSKAKEYGVNADKAVAVAKCESHLIHDVQSFIVHDDGTREESWGIWQWYLPAKNKTDSGTLITKEIAIDPIAATNAAMEKLGKGRWGMWSCSRILGYIK